MSLELQSLRLRVNHATPLFSGLNLAELCSKEYPRPARLLLWIMVEIAIIASDIQEVIGSALAINILTNGALVQCIV